MWTLRPPLVLQILVHFSHGYSGKRRNTFVRVFKIYSPIHINMQGVTVVLQYCNSIKGCSVKIVGVMRDVTLERVVKSGV